MITDDQFKAAMKKYLLASWRELDWSRTTPCGDCPFLKASPFHRGVCSNLETYISAIERGVFAHTCHKTDNQETCDGPKNFEGRTQHCAGALIMLLKSGNGYDIQTPLIQAMDAGAVDIKRLAAIAAADEEVFTILELVRFYAEEAAKDDAEISRMHHKFIGPATVVRDPFKKLSFHQN